MPAAELLEALVALLAMLDRPAARAVLLAPRPSMLDRRAG
jgi:hypothetical protein